MNDYELVVFIRHKLSSGSNIIDEFWENGIVGIHYGDLCSFNADDYEELSVNTRKALKSNFKLMEEIQEKGALVAADYRNPVNKDEKKNRAMLVGVIEKGTKKEPKWFTDTDTGKKYCYKILKMKNPKEIYYEDHPILLSCKPLRATMCKWHLMKDKLPAIYENKPLSDKVTSLTYAELEVICYEYLRYDVLECLLLPIGRTLNDVDIVGLDKKGEKILAQVTFTKTKNNENKARQLSNARKSKNTQLYYFGFENQRSLVKKVDKEIKFISLEDVFSTVKTLGNVKKAIAIMLNR